MQIRFGCIISQHPKVLSLFLTGWVISWPQTGHFVWSDQNLHCWKLFLQPKRSDWHVYTRFVKHHVIFSWEIVQIRFGRIISRHPKVLSLFLISRVISWSQTGHFVWSDQNIHRWKLFLQRKLSDWHVYPSLVNHHVIFHKKLLVLDSFSCQKVWMLSDFCDLLDFPLYIDFI